MDSYSYLSGFQDSIVRFYFVRKLIASLLMQSFSFRFILMAFIPNKLQTKTNILAVAVGDHPRSVAAEETQKAVRAADLNAEQ